MVWEHHVTGALKRAIDPGRKGLRATLTGFCTPSI